MTHIKLANKLIIVIKIIITNFLQLESLSKKTILDLLRIGYYFTKYITCKV